MSFKVSFESGTTCALALRISKLEARGSRVINGKLTIPMIDGIVNETISESELTRWLPAIEPILLASSQGEARPEEPG